MRNIMSLKTFIFPQARPGREHPVTEYSKPAQIRDTVTGPGISKVGEALNDGPPPVRVIRQWRDGLSGWNGISQFATPQQAHGIASIQAQSYGNYANLPPPVIPRRSALGGALAGLSQASSLRVPSVYVPVANLAASPTDLHSPGISNG